MVTCPQCGASTKVSIQRFYVANETMEWKRHGKGIKKPRRSLKMCAINGFRHDTRIFIICTICEYVSNNLNGWYNSIEGYEKECDLLCEQANNFG